MSDGQVCKNCGYERVESDSGSLGSCPKCTMPYAWSASSPPKRPVNPPSTPAAEVAPAARLPTVAAPVPRPQAADAPTNAPGGQLEACVATAVLVLGCFAPIVTLPIVGDLNYVGGGKRDGMFVIALAVIGLLLAFTGRMRALMITGGLAAAAIGFSLFDLLGRVDAAKTEMTRGASGMLGGVARALAESVQIEWGWVPLVAGAALTVAVGAGLRFQR